MAALLLTHAFGQEPASDSLKGAIRLADPGTEGWIQAVFHYSSKEPDPDSTIRYTRLALREAQRLGLPVWQLKCHEHLARTLLNSRTRLDSVDLHLGHAHLLYRAVPDSLYYLSSLLRIRGEAFRQKGEFGQANEYLDRAAATIARGLKQAENNEDRTALLQKQVIILNARGNVLKNMGRCDEAIAVQQEVYRLSETLGNNEQMGYATFNMGGCYFVLGDYPRALDAYLSSLGILDDEASQASMIANVSLAVGAIFAETGQLDSARAYFQRALRVGSDYQRVRTRIGTLENLGGVEGLAGRYDSARYYYEQAAALARDGERWAMLVTNLTNLGSVHMELGNTPKAFSYLQEANELADQEQLTVEKAYVLITLAEYYLKTNQPAQAVPYLLQTETYVVRYPAADLRLRTAKAQSEAYQALGRYQEALVNYQQYVALDDSLRDEDKIRAITQLNMQHEFEEERNLAAARQREKDLLVAERLQRQQLQRNALIAIAVAIALLTLLIWRGYRQKRRTNALLETKNEVIQCSLDEKETLLREIHHRVKNNLQVISSLLAIQSRNVTDTSVQEAIEEGRNRVNSMAMIHQNLYQTEHLTGIDMDAYIDQLTHSLFDSYNIDTDRVQLRTDISPMVLDVDTVIPLGLILNELITNALKYAFPEEQAGEIVVSLQQESDTLTLQVADNGVGFPEDLQPEAADSMGFRLIRAFLAKLKGQMEIVRSGGTTVRLRFTQYQQV